MITTSGLWQAIIVIICIAFVFYMYIKKFKDIHYELIIAGVISFIWVLMSGLYVYKDTNYIILGLNIFTFVAWTTGLVVLREIYEAMHSKLKLIYASLIYTILIIAVEYIGYNWWMIQLNSNYAGFLGLPIMHMPLFGQIYYLVAGPVYLFLTEWIGVD